MMQFLVGKWRQFDEFIKKRNRLRLEARRVSVTDQGFDLIDPKANYRSVSWTKVYSINAFKRDLFCLDMICFEFFQDGLESPIEVNEQMEGWQVLLDILPSKFSGFDLNWYAKVAQPPFAPNFTELWKRRGVMLSKA